FFALRKVPAAAALFALLLDLVERLREALERILIGRRRAAPRSALHGEIDALAHAVDHARLLADVFDPGAVVLSVHGEFCGPDLGRGVGTGFEGIADNDRHFIFHLLAGAGRDEQVGLTALAAGRFHFRRLRLGERKADLAAAGRGGIRAPIAVLPEERRLGIASGGGGRSRGRGGGGRGAGGAWGSAAPGGGRGGAGGGRGAWAEAS